MTQAGARTRCYDRDPFGVRVRYLRCVSDQGFRPGASGVFKVIVESARKFKRAVTGGDDELAPEAQQLGTQIAQAFVAGRFADVHALGTAAFQARTSRDAFVEGWRASLHERGPLTGYDLADAGEIDMGYVPGLEDIPQSEFVAFLEIVFSTPAVPLDDPSALTIGAVLVDDGGRPRLGALHAR